MGSLDRYLRCKRCNGLFADPKDAESHTAICQGDVAATVCDLVACKKVNYVKYVQPHVAQKRFTQVVYRYTPKSKKVRQAHPARDSWRKPTDSGDMPLDSGETLPDSGDTPHDSGDTPHDSGDTPHDSGDTPHDSCDTPHDSGNMPPDSGDMPHDSCDMPHESGDTTLDSGDTPLDIGDTTLDTGDTPPDSGYTPPDSGEMPHDSCDTQLDSAGTPPDSNDAPLSTNNRRYGLRKGASEALHARITSMQHLLGMRGISEQRSLIKTNVIQPTTDDKVKEHTDFEDRTEHCDLELPEEPQQSVPPKEPFPENEVSHDKDMDGIVEITPQDNCANDSSAPPTRLRTRSCRTQRERNLMTSLLSRVKVEAQAGEAITEERAEEDGMVKRLQPTTQEHTYSHSVEGPVVSEGSKGREPEHPVAPAASPEANAGSDVEAVMESDIRVSNRLRLKQRKGRSGVLAKTDRPTADGQGVFHCTICAYTSRKQGMFMRHMGAHNNGQMYTCEFCDARFIYRRLYKQHLGIHKGFRCDVCSKMFSRRHDLSRHVETTHSGTKKYMCAVCGYECCHHHMYTDHMRKHTNDRYRCTEPACQFVTIYRRALMHHLSTVHNAEKHIVCDLCGYKTNDNCAFSKHRKTHSDEKAFSCGLCDYKAHSLSYVTTHQATHQQEKVYMCDQCDYSSVRPTGIRSHMMKHIGVNPWQCPNCEYSSTTRHKVARHISMRHKGSGQPIRRNITIKFDVNAFKVDRMKGVSGDTEQQQGSTTVEGDVMLGHKYMVIEMVDDSTGTALSSGLVGEEVVVHDEPDDIADVQQPQGFVPFPSESSHPPDTPPPAEDDPSSSPLCLYKCALCQFTHPILEVVQDHMATLHPDFISAEIIDDAEVEADQAEACEIQQASTEETVSLEIAMETVEEVRCGYPEGTMSIQAEEGEEVVETIEIAPMVAYPRQSVTMQDDAVSTAVESILHLQNVPVKEEAG